MTAERLRPHLEGWLASGGPGRTFVVHLDGGWSGSEQLLVGDHYVDVRVCPSELAVREELSRERPDGRTLVLLSPAEIQGADVLARIAKRRVLRLHAWEAVQTLFGVRQIDPVILSERWMAEALVEAAPPGGYEKTAARALDADRAWRTLLEHRYGIVADGGLDALATWAAGPGTDRLGERSPEEYAAVRRRLSSSVPGSEVVLGAVAAGRGGEVVAIGLVARVLADGPAGEDRAAARALATTLLLGGWAFEEAAARALAEVAERRVGELLRSDPPLAHTVLRSADTVVATLNAEPLVAVSDLLASGLRARRADLGAALARRRAGTAAAVEIERAADRIRAHRVSDHHRVAEMVVRAVRWLDARSANPQDFSTAAGAYAGDSCYADWARTELRVVTGDAALDDELRALVAELDARRRDEDTRFASLLAAYVGHAAAGAPVLGVEEVLDRVVAPLARQRPVLFLVLDGMSHRVASELLEDVVARGWSELRPDEQNGRTLVLSALPSVTEFSRTSLLSGELVKGKMANEAKAFAGHPALVEVSARGGAPVLFHKGALKDPHGGLAAELRSELAGDRRVVGVVVNAIDDHLARNDQLAAPWDTGYIPLLRLLLDEARDADRLVVLASDHGHVLDHGGASRSGGPEHGERWRGVGTGPEDGEQLVEGTRVLVPGGRCVLAVDELVRYAPRKHGYHGGGSPQEVLAPLLVLTAGAADGVEGWSEAPYDVPNWWLGGPQDDVAVEMPVEPRRPASEEVSGQLTLAPATDVEPTGPGLVPAWLGALQESQVFTDALAAAGRARVPQERFVGILAALDAAGGKLLLDALARRTGIAPLRLRGTLATMRLHLNVEGFDVLTLDEDSGDVILDLALLRQQFGLEAS